MKSIFMLLLAAVVTKHATACSCRPLNLNEILEGNNLVFRGTVLRYIHTAPPAVVNPIMPPGEGFNVTSNNSSSSSSSMPSSLLLPSELIKAPEPGMHRYIVQIAKVFKGCGGSNATSIKALDRIVVTSNVGGAICGMELELNAQYVFVASQTSRQPLDATIKAQLGNRSKVKQSVWISSCGYNRMWKAVPEVDKNTMRGYKQQC